MSALYEFEGPNGEKCPGVYWADAGGGAYWVTYARRFFRVRRRRVAEGRGAKGATTWVVAAE